MANWNNFVDAVEKHFSFLKDECGFSIVSAKEPFVVFGSADIRVNVYCDVSRHVELDLGIERVADVGKRMPFFRIHEFRRILGIQLQSGTAPFIETEEQMAVELEKLACDLKQYCSEVLHGNLSVFEQIERRRIEGI
ncbi:MAG: hypothetical protein U1E27_08830 [Kiritimatiellia bacterium]|nr:hypothetical protein [Kiritimatiellia bacterium]